MMNGMMTTNNMMMVCMAASTLFALVIAVAVVQAVLPAKILGELRRLNDERG